jgi:hypothetical protein
MEENSDSIFYVILPLKTIMFGYILGKTVDIWFSKTLDYFLCKQMYLQYLWFLKEKDPVCVSHKIFSSEVRGEPLKMCSSKIYQGSFLPFALNLVFTITLYFIHL